MQRYGLQKWRDESKLNVFLFKRVEHNYFGGYIKSWSLVNKQTLSTSRYSNHAAGLKSVYNLNHKVILKPYLGYQRSENKSYIDFGWDVGIDAGINRIYLGDYRTSLYISSDFDLYPQRENISNQVDLHIQKQFSSLARDSLRVIYTKSKQQYYYSPLHPFINLDLESKSLYNTLTYTLSSRSYMQLNTIIIDRKISDDTPVNPNIRNVFRIENRFGYRYYSPKFLIYLGMHTFQETQDNVNIRTDSKAAQIGARADFSFFLSDADRIDFQLDMIKFQYDTPAIEENYDDRDEIRMVGQTSYSHRFSPLLSINLNGYVNLYHSMYISKQQSANNNWNRIYRIEARVKYKYQDLLNILRTQILANYTTYDYDHLFARAKSFVFRKYSISDSLIVPLFNQTFCDLYARLELEDRGSFYKELFAQNILESSQILYLDISLRRKSIFRVNIDFGCAVYQRKNWRHLPIAVETRNISRLSPYIKIIYPLQRSLRLIAQITQNYQRDKGRERSEYTYGKIDLYYML